ncbi:MAG: hypothetical protein U9N55_06300 [candidate division Zixibacteria bacterium]|nr:hypothetical protein [candidate division Zixibacteria bacterium]
MNRFACIVWLVMSLSLNSIVEAGVDRPTFLGFSPAFPTDTVAVFEPPSNPPYLTREQQTTVIVDINKSGEVINVQAENSQNIDIDIATYVYNHIMAFSFQAALFNDKPVASKLPVLVTMQPNRRYPNFMFPISSDRVVKNRKLYMRTYGFNDIRLPTLEVFPKYFCNLPSNDSSNLYPFVLLKVSLDENGQLLDVQEVFSTYPPCAQTTASAALWSDYAPALVKGKPTPSECFVVVSWFREIAFSLSKWKLSNVDTLSPLQRWRVELFPDTVGLLHTPLPRSAGKLEFDSPRNRFPSNDTVSAVLLIDTSGETSILHFSKTSKVIHQAIRKLGKKLAFYPAIDYAGLPQPFTGLVHLVFDNSGRIRIDCQW